MQLIREIFPDTSRLLKRIYRQSRHHQVRQRAHCLLLHQEGFSIPKLQDIFQVSRKTLYNWLNAWEQKGLVGLYNQPGRGRKPTFTPEQQQQIRLWTQEHPKQLKQVLQKVKESWNIDVSKQTIKRVLKTMQMSWHRFRRGVGGQPDPQEYAAKRKQLEQLQRLDQAGEIDLYYMDESGFCLTPCVPDGWQLIAQTLEIPSQHSKRLNVLGLMKRDNQLECYVSTQTIDSRVVIACIDAFFPAPQRRTVIVADQASIHTSDEIHDKLEEWKERQIEIFNLPSYSPELNLIEILWRFIKYEWIEISAYKCWSSFVDYVEKVLREFGSTYVINFV